ncbi:DsbA family protein [Haloarchaeobius amylolyticus]|uniref:DsbA family protein n=1 Tax=Haloarchaeobius amylolyticus TaxID=1198296 RepID=UPI0022700699|nr:thioredoxin domain-containing protein [Haloarchaeobius amylolyticus]
MSERRASSDGATRRDALRLAGAAGAAGLTALSGCAALGSSVPGESGGGGDVTTTGGSGGGGGTASDDPARVRASTKETPLGTSLAGNPVQGAPDAPVDLYYWSDFQCPFCKRFEKNTRPKLVEGPVADGQVRLVYLELPNIGSASWRAAAHSKCVWRRVKDDDPGTYLDWHEAVYAAQEKPNSGWANRENLLSITESVDGVSRDGVETCLSESEQAVKDTIRADVERAKSHGIAVTPSFLLHDKADEETRQIAGAQPYERFASVLRSMLA